jgi:hypothetical protein
MKITDALLRFRAEFADVKSLADVPRLSPERLKRFKQQLDELDPPAPKRGPLHSEKEKKSESKWPSRKRAQIAIPQND